MMTISLHFSEGEQFGDLVLFPKDGATSSFTSFKLKNGPAFQDVFVSDPAAARAMAAILIQAAGMLESHRALSAARIVEAQP